MDWIGQKVVPGTFGIINHRGLPKILTQPGRYPGFPLRNWWARSWVGTKKFSDTVIEYNGLTVVQILHNQAAVILDPQSRVFVVKDSGFVAFPVEGTYDVLAIVDQTHLPGVVKDKNTGVILGWTHEVKMKSSNGSEHHVALFLKIPFNNCAILQKGNDLELLHAGQHCINPDFTLRGMFTKCENQMEMSTKDIFTKDQVSVSLKIYLKWELTEPLKLTRYGYNTPFEALKDNTQSILRQIVAHFDYGAMMKQRLLSLDNMEDTKDPSPFLETWETQAVDEMRSRSSDYGIKLKDLAIIDRQFKGEIPSTMDKLITRALQAQVEAANVDRENSNKAKQEEGALSVARIKADAQAECAKIKAEADADVVRIKARAECFFWML